MLLESPLSEQVVAVVIDEAHCVYMVNMKLEYSCR